MVCSRKTGADEDALPRTTAIPRCVCTLDICVGVIPDHCTQASKHTHTVLRRDAQATRACEKALSATCSSCATLVDYTLSEEWQTKSIVGLAIYSKQCRHSRQCRRCRQCRQCSAVQCSAPLVLNIYVLCEWVRVRRRGGPGCMLMSDHAL